MKIPLKTCPVVLILFIIPIIGFTEQNHNPGAFRVVWKENNMEGSITLDRGTISKVNAGKGKVRKSDKGFYFATEGGAVVSVETADFSIEPGPNPTIVSIKTARYPFSFLLRDVSKDYPIFIPDYGVAVLPSDDNRSYAEVEKEVLQRKIRTKIQRIEEERETSFESAAQTTRNMSVPIWLGLSRDMRMFEISEELEDMGQEGKIIRPRYGGATYVKLPETEHQAYIYALGRGVGVKNNITRRLDGGVLPVYHSELTDDDVRYHTISFVSFAQTRLTASENKGTHYAVADKHSGGRRFADEHAKEVEERMKTAYEFDDDVVLYARTTIENTGAVPRYAWVKIPRPGTRWHYKKVHDYDSTAGFSFYTEDRVFCISRLNGTAPPNEEVSILLKPGEKIEYDIFLPHTPVSAEKAAEIGKQSFGSRLEEARSYWKKKLAAASSISLPEKRIEEMLQAGLLHLDLITYGQEPDGTLAPHIGVFTPIGTESSPIIQFYLSMGWFDVAKRTLNYFLDTQQKNGYIQNYAGYTIETGAALWTMGEYMRYTADRNWLNSSKEKILKSCEYLLEWRNKNKKDSLVGRGYGMIDGRVADPIDDYRQFMLNGYAYLGLSRIGEVLKAVDPLASDRILAEADLWKADILKTVKTLLGISPVVPLGDGRWTPMLPPWAEADAPRALLLKNETFWSHGTFTGIDALTGPMYLVFCEVIAPEAPEAKMLLDYHSELFYQENTAFSQPYYSRHNWLQAKLGMAKPFLNTYYNTMSGQADRSTYTFWEHTYRNSQHKTHEEAWFLMETRWMLYMEDGDTLSLLKTIPRAWMEDGKEILLDNVKSFFGGISLKAKSNTAKGYIEASVECPEDRKPRVVTLRLPHPESKRPTKVTGGTYDPVTEAITIDNFNGTARIRVEF